ncbi:MAG: hypothetical protein M4579_006875 [Chaenotheca gracillima]|nr:MAG: hypothetical protein M4579_006875 [Chaenotheca gracillima]
MKSEDRPSTKVRISFCREREDRDRGPKSEEEWKCLNCMFPNYARRTECRRCAASREDAAIYEEPTETRFVNTGESDMSPDGTPSQFLLFRDLEVSVTEELLARGAAKLYKTSDNSLPQAQPAKKNNYKVSSTSSDAHLGAREGSLKRVLLVKDRRTGDSWRYGFAEFSSTEDSQAALAKYNAQERFTISSKQVKVNFIHAGVFVPMLNPNPHLERFTFSPLSNPSLKLAYWDEEGYVSELVIPEQESDSKSTAPKKTSSASQKAAAAEKEGLVKVSKENEVKSKKRKVDAAAAANNKKAIPAHLSFWRNRHAELHGIASNKADTDLGAPSRDDENGSTAKKIAAEDAAPPLRSFADMDRKCCLLCSRQFKSDAEVHKHERLSKLHRDNLGSEELKQKALAKLSKAEGDADQPAYRDRARERRTAFNQPKRPSAPEAGTQLRTKEPDTAAPEEVPTAQSKGAALLGKMGWNAGEGLGVQGEGMAAPIETELYVQGVGLGAQGGKVGDAVVEAGRNTKGQYSDFLEKTRDKAKERFERLA